MTQSDQHPSAGHAEPVPSDGISDVAEVLSAIEGLDDRPVADHVAVFEEAHERLRRALDPPRG